MTRFSASLPMMVPDRPLAERVRLITSAGLDVGIWHVSEAEIEAIRDGGAKVSSMIGFGGGNLASPEAAELYVRTAVGKIPTAHELGEPVLILHGGELSADGSAVDSMETTTHLNRETAHSTLSKLGQIAAEANVVYCLENLNPSDHPGVPFARVEDVFDLVSRVDSPGIRVSLDFYHAARDGVDLMDLVDSVDPTLIGEVHIADSPSRHWPGDFNVDYVPIIARLLDRGYDGNVLLEGWVLDHPSHALLEFAQLRSGSEVA